MRRSLPALPGGRWLCALLSALLFACVLAPASAEIGHEPPTYLIGPGDSLTVTIWQHDDLSSTVIVRPDGRITLPLVEDLVAAGKTPMDLADEIEASLSEYIKSPSVVVAVGSGLGDPRQQIRIVGKSAQPVSLAYRSGMTLLDAIIAGGGLSRQADGNGTVIVRQTETGNERIPVRLADLVRDGDSSANVPLQPGDVIIIPEGFIEGEWRVTYGAAASTTFSDNIDQDPDGDREAGLVVRYGPQMSIAGSSARVTAGFNGDLSGVSQFGGDNTGFSIDPRINGTSTTELAPDLLFFDLRASLARQLLDSRQSNSASGSSTTNTDFVATLTASPYLVHRVGDFADAEWRYSFSPTLIDSDSNSNAYSHRGSFVLDSGEDFSALGWTWSNSVGEEVRTDEADIATASTDLGLSYALSRDFALLGGIGFEYRDGDSDSDNNFDGLTWRGGFAWVPHPDFNLEATYGRRDDDESLDASLSYKLGAKTSLNASYSEALETSQERAVSNLGNLVFDPETGELTDQQTGQVFDPDDPFSFDDETTRTRTLRLGADYRSGRNTFRLSGFAGTSEGGSSGDEEFYRAQLTWGRTLSSDLTFTSSAGFKRSDYDEDNRSDDTYDVDLGLAYRITSDARATMSYSFESRDSDEDDQSYFENAVTLGLSISF